MKLRRQIFLAFATALFVCVSVSTAFASALQNNTSYVQRKVSSGKFPIHSACMMPPQGHLIKIGFKSIGFKSVEEMPQESESWAEALEAIVEAQLKARGISVTSAANPLSSGASADAIKEVIAQVQQKFKAVSALMYKKPKAIAKSAYTLGDQVGMLPCSENSDIVVFVQGQGQVVTAGSGLEDAADLFITLADAKTGEILGLIQLYPDCNFLLVPEACIGPDLDIELTDMNLGSFRKKAKTNGH
ncbi:MAG: hypothetical protein ABSA48_13195 [Terracidiphilus sp.]|jgi:hypothetical protein